MSSDQNPRLGVILFVVLVIKYVCCNGKQKTLDATDAYRISLWVSIFDRDLTLEDGEINIWFPPQLMYNLKES